MTMNQNLLFITVAFLGLVSVTIFFYLIFLKIKLMELRKNLQQEGLIKNSFNVYFASFFELVFWILPVFIKYKVNNESYNRLITRMNVLWFIMIISAFLVLRIA